MIYWATTAPKQQGKKLQTEIAEAMSQNKPVLHLTYLNHSITVMEIWLSNSIYFYLILCEHKLCKYLMYWHPHWILVPDGYVLLRKMNLKP
jgi:hypothetical protein